MAWLVEHEAIVRLGAFASVLLALALAQRLWPARGDGRPARRQAVNIALAVVDALVLRLLFPLLAVGLALRMQSDGAGLFNRLDWPLWLSVPLAVLLLDLAIYWQHRLMHALPPLWRLHRVHHSDVGFDVSTGVRFHPLEIALSMAIKLGLVWLLGPHPAAVVAFELLLSLGSLFTHTDIALPTRVDQALRRLLVTPSMHRIHHSVRREETDSNFGFHLSIWDRLFTSYRATPIEAERTMTIGLGEFREPDAQSFGALLGQPFRRTRSPPRPESERPTAAKSDRL